MAEQFTEAAKKMVIFLIVGQTFLHFGMGKAYERYIKLTLSLMLVAQLVSVVLGALLSFGRGEKASLVQQAGGDFRQQWEKSQEEFEERMELKQKSLEEVWKKKNEEMTMKEETGEERGIRIEEIRIQ